MVIKDKFHMWRLHSILPQFSIDCLLNSSRSMDRYNRVMRRLRQEEPSASALGDLHSRAKRAVKESMRAEEEEEKERRFKRDADG